MITRTEFDLYRTPEFMEAVETNLDRVPGAIALDKRIPFARELATRVKYLQKAKIKLPSYFAARCVIPPRAYEQSTGESVAVDKVYRGESCLDLTCGLGVDSLFLSKGFDKVVSLERDLLLADIARYNFALLGARNIEVVTCSAEDYLACNPDTHFDLVYADPDRRGDGGKRVAALGDCRPDVRSLLPQLKEMARTVAVKLSPLFDVHEALRIFGRGTRVTVISDGGECKEVLVETGEGIDEQEVTARITGKGSVTYPYRLIREYTAQIADGIEGAQYVCVPDVALAVSGIAPLFFASYGWRMSSPRGLAFGGTELPALAGRVFRIVEALPYNPRAIKSLLAGRGVRKLNFIVRDFPYSTARVARQVGVKEGGTDMAALTTMGGKPALIILGPADGPDTAESIW